MKKSKKNKKPIKPISYRGGGGVRTEDEILEELKIRIEYLRQQTDFTNALFKSISGYAIIAANFDGEIIAYNKGAEDIYGYSAEKIIGESTNIEMLYPRDFIEAGGLQHLIDSVMSKELYRYEGEKVRKGGESFPARIILSLVKTNDGKMIGFVEIVEDLTEIRRAEEEIKKLNEDLRQRAEDLESINKELKAFAYSISHDLQAPLRPLEGFSQIILRDYADKLDDRGRQLLNRIKESAQKMERLINDILSFSRTGQKDMIFSEINMNELVGAVIEEIKTINSSRRLQFDVKPLPSVYGDLPMLKQVFVNLISNAVKFTAPKDTAIIEIGCKPEENENVCYVKDNGVGFDMKYADRLFGVFHRLHGEDEFKGTGIGLAIVKRIIRRHDCRIWAEGKVNEGAVFYFTLPKQATGNRQ